MVWLCREKCASDVLFWKKFRLRWYFRLAEFIEHRISLMSSNKSPHLVWRKELGSWQLRLLLSISRGKMCEKVKNISGYENFSFPPVTTTTTWTAEDEETAARKIRPENERAASQFVRLQERAWAKDREKICQEGGKTWCVETTEENLRILTIIKLRVCIFVGENRTLTRGKTRKTAQREAKTSNENKKISTKQRKKWARQYWRIRLASSFSYFKLKIYPSVKETRERR